MENTELVPARMQNTTTLATVGKSRLNLLLVMIMAFAVALTSLMMPSAAFAESNDEKAAQVQLQGYVKQEVAGNSYSINGGGNMMGNDLLVMNPTTNQFEVDGVKFSQLDSKGQKAFVEDIAQAARNAASPANPQKAAQTPLVNDQTVTNWFRDIQNTPGVGSKMLAEMMGRTAPDFVGAHQVLSPIQGIFNLILGVLGVLMMMGLAFTILFDITYIVIPFVRASVGDGNGDGDKSKVRKVFSVSTDALTAMKKADEENGSSAKALWSYLKTRALGLIIFGILLTLLVQGKLFNLVGSVMDMVSGLPIFN